MVKSFPELVNTQLKIVCPYKYKETQNKTKAIEKKKLKPKIMSIGSITFKKRGILKMVILKSEGEIFFKAPNSYKEMCICDKRFQMNIQLKL